MRPLFPEKLGSFGPASSDVHAGYVRDIVGAVRMYIVQAGTSTFTCVDLSQLGCFTSSGPRRIGGYPVGSNVLVWTPPSTKHGFILGAMPFKGNARNFNLPDDLAGFTGSDTHNNASHWYLAKTAGFGGFGDYSSGRPYEWVPGSDEGMINELGVGFGVSRMFSWIRASDMAGLWCFHQDRLSRLAAYNFEMWHAGGESWLKNDEGEVSRVDTLTPYPWEALGATAHGLALQEVEGGGIYRQGQTRPWYEPKVSGQIGIPRLTRFEGYLGDISHEVVSAPDSMDEPEAYGKATEYHGLSEVHRGGDGFIGIRSARGISIRKDVAIPVPKQMQPPEAPALEEGGGDDHTNYQAAGLTEEGEIAHPRKDFTPGGDTGAAYLASLRGYHSWMFNYYGIQTLVAHGQDWHVPAGKLPGEDEPGPAINTLGQALDGDFQYPLPDSRTLKVDHRYEEGVRYFRSSAGIDILPDGSVSIEDGYGGGIHLSGGNMYLSVPGDIFLTPGRSVHAMAGRDITLRAQRSADLTASARDVRIKAEKNVHVLSGNGGVGSTLLENRGRATEMDFSKVGEESSSSGIIMKSEAAGITVYGGSIYMRSGDNLDLTLDAGGGTGLRTDVGNEHRRWANTRFMDTAGAVPSAGGDLPDSAATNIFDPTNLIFGSRGLAHFECASVMFWGDNTALNVSGSVYAERNIAAGSQISSLLGIATDGPVVARGAVVGWGHFASQSGGLVGRLEDEPEALDYGDISTTLTDTDSAIEDLTGEIGRNSLDALNTAYYEDGRPGNAEIRSSVGFTFRNAEQYGVENSGFFLFEQRWQQVYREQGLGHTWTEPAVDPPPGAGSGEVTYPYPGAAALSEEEVFVIDESAVLWDGQNSRNAADRAAYDPKVPTLARYKMSEKYLVSVPPPA